MDESVETLDQEPDFRVYPIGPASGRVLPVLDARGKGEAVHKEVSFRRTSLSSLVLLMHGSSIFILVIDLHFLSSMNHFFILLFVSHHALLLLSKKSGRTSPDSTLLSVHCH